MRVLILTSSMRGTAAAILPILAAETSAQIVGIVRSEGQIANRKRYLRRKVDKVREIGLGGAINGYRMRRWYKEDVHDLLGTRPLDALCADLGLPLWTTPTINSDTTERLFESAEADIGLSLGNSYIASRIFEIPRLGMLNVHHELLPAYQGAQSVIWQLHNGSTVSGYTIHRINKKIDDGAIVLSREVPIVFGDSLGDTVSRTYARLIEASAHGLAEVVNGLPTTVENAQPQAGGSSYTTPSLAQYRRMKRNHDRLKRSTAT